MEVLDVNAYVLGRFKAKIPLECKLASSADMQMVFDHWPDSKEEYDRHYEVYYRWGFKRCFLFSHCDTGEIVHFSILLMYEDRPKIKQFLPRKRYRVLDSESCAHQDWVYTFEKYRQLGILTQAMDFVIEFCRENGIKWLYSDRGMSNVPSIRYADKIGYVPIAIVHHFQFVNQQKHSGFYFVRRIRKSASIC
jgi:GNAT superfamily N-acetyltransferase